MRGGLKRRHFARGTRFARRERMQTKTLPTFFESTLLAMLAAASGCGGTVAQEGSSDAGGTDARTPLKDADALVDAAHDSYVPPADPCAAPSRSYSLDQCGEGGDRLTSTAGCLTVFRQLPCELETADAGSCGYGPAIDDCNAFCKGPGSSQNPFPTGCDVRIYKDGKRELECTAECPGGRRPEGYGGEASTAHHPLGRFFARLAQLETVSIGAFGALATELERHGAAASLVARARRARRDEVRHARAAWSLARRFGAPTERLARMPRARARSVADLAEENAAEGCVRETFGAIIARFQGRRSEDAQIAEAMRAIAVDEADHAALAWDLDAFFMTRLDARGRARRARAIRRALAELRDEIERSVDVPSLARISGMPNRDVARVALGALEHALT
jgi:hypothetical protein